MKSYKDLDIYNLSLTLFYKTHGVSLKLPKYELYELGSQLRRSSDSIATNIVEGYGRKRYKQDFIKFLTYSHASNLETMCHLEKLQFYIPVYWMSWPQSKRSTIYLVQNYFPFCDM